MTFYYKKSAEKSAETDKVWTQKHDEFCLENRITPAARLLWQYLIKQGKSDNECEPDLAEFNAEIAKHRGKGYSRVHLKNAFQQLINLRVIHLVKRFTWRLVRIVTRTISDLFPKKKLRNENEIYALPRSNPQSSEGATRQQQQSSLIQENLSILADAGINFKPEELEVLDRPSNEIKLAIEIFYMRGGFEKSKNPEGFIRTCLRERYWEEDRNYEALVNKFGNTTIYDELFPDNNLNELRPLLTLFGLDINSIKNFPRLEGSPTK